MARIETNVTKVRDIVQQLLKLDKKPFYTNEFSHMSNRRSVKFPNIFLTAEQAEEVVALALQQDVHVVKHYDTRKRNWRTELEGYMFLIQE